MEFSTLMAAHRIGQRWRWLAGLLFFGILTLWIPAYWPISVFQLGIFVLAGAAAWGVRRCPLVWSWPFVPLALAAVWGYIQWVTARTAYGYETKLAILRWVTYLCVFLAGTSFLRDEAISRRVRRAMVWFAFIVSAVATLQSYTSGGKVFWIFATPYTDFVMGPMLSRNDFAAFVEVALPIALYEALHGDRDSLLYSGMAATLCASVVASASRAGVILVTAEVMLISLILWARHGRSRKLTGLAILRVGLLAAVLVTAVGIRPLWSRLRIPDPMAGRREFAIATWRMAIEHPWTGVGLGNWSTMYPAYEVIDLNAAVNHAHNDWLEWMAEGGFPFGILLFTLFFWSLQRAWRSVWGLGVVAVFLHALVDDPFARPALGSWSIVVLAMLAVACNDIEPDRGAVHSITKRRLTYVNAHEPP